MKYYVVFKQENGQYTCVIHTIDPEQPEQHIFTELNLAIWQDFLKQRFGNTVPSPMTYQLMWELRLFERSFFHDLIMLPYKEPLKCHQQVIVSSPHKYRANYFWQDLFNVLSAAVAHSFKMRQRREDIVQRLLSRQQTPNDSEEPITQLKEQLRSRLESSVTSEDQTIKSISSQVRDPQEYFVRDIGHDAFLVDLLFPAGADILYHLQNKEKQLTVEEFLALLAKLQVESPEFFLTQISESAKHPPLHIVFCLIQSSRSDLLVAALKCYPGIAVQINKQYIYGQSPLLIAARICDVLLTKVLLEHGADPLQLSQFGLSPVGEIVTLGHFGQAYARDDTPQAISPEKLASVIACLELFAQHCPASLTQVNFNPVLDQKGQFDLVRIAHLGKIMPGYNTPLSAVLWLLVSLPDSDPRLPALQKIFDFLISKIKENKALVINPLVLRNTELNRDITVLDYYVAALIAYWLQEFSSFCKKQGGYSVVIETYRGQVERFYELSRMHVSVYPHLTEAQECALSHIPFSREALEAFLSRWQELRADFNQDYDDSFLVRAMSTLEELKNFLTSVTPSPSTAVIPGIFQPASAVPQPVDIEKITAQISSRPDLFTFGDDEERSDFINYALQQLEESALDGDQLLARLEELKKTFSEQPAAAACS